MEFWKAAASALHFFPTLLKKIIFPDLFKVGNRKNNSRPFSRPWEPWVEKSERARGKGKKKVKGQGEKGRKKVKKVGKRGGRGRKREKMEEISLNGGEGFQEAS